MTYTPPSTHLPPASTPRVLSHGIPPRRTLCWPLTATGSLRVLPPQTSPATCDAPACTALLTTLLEPPAARVPAYNDGVPRSLPPYTYGVGAVTVHSYPGRPHLLSATDNCSEVAWGGLGNLHVDLGQGLRRSCPFKLAFFEVPTVSTMPTGRSFNSPRRHRHRDTHCNVGTGGRAGLLLPLGHGAGGGIARIACPPRPPGRGGAGDHARGGRPRRTPCSGCARGHVHRCCCRRTPCNHAVSGHARICRPRRTPCSCNACDHACRSRFRRNLCTCFAGGHARTCVCHNFPAQLNYCWRWQAQRRLHARPQQQSPQVAPL